MARHKADNELNKLLSARNERMRKLQQIVKEAIDEQELILNNLAHPPQESITRGQKLADKVAAFGGSWGFIIAFFLVLAGWIVYNVVAPAKEIFDPYPFILMNLVLSCLAAVQAPVIMMSQNRQEEKDRKRNENDYLINLKSELELRSLHQKMDMLIGDDVRAIGEVQQQQIRLLHALERKLALMSAGHGGAQGT
jgi:uncharacterized membrane protein